MTLQEAIKQHETFHIQADGRQGTIGYVVYVCEHLRDGVEEGAKCFVKLEDALAFINADRFARDNHTFRLFKLGKELPLSADDVTEPQPAKVVKRFKVGE